MIAMVNNASINSNQFILLIALGSVLMVPITPELALFASVVDSAIISSSVIFSARLTVSLKSSKTKIPSPASSFNILSKSTSSACGLNSFI